METLAFLIGQLLLGWLIADLLAGIAHWIEDRVLRDSQSWIGRMIVAPNRLHHRAPAAFLTGSFLERNLTTIVAAGVGSLIWITLFGFSLVWLSATIAGCGASVAHYWAHDPRSGGNVVRMLQEMALLPIIGIALAVVAGIALLAAGAYLIYSNWGAIGAFFSNLWTGIKGAFATASDAVLSVFGRMWSGVTSIFSMSFADIFKAIAYFHGVALGALFRFGSAIVGWLVGTLPGILASGWSAAWSMFTGAISASLTWLTTALPAMLSNGWRFAWTAFKTALRVAFVELPSMFINFGVMIVQGLWNGIKSAPGKLWNAGKELAGSLAGGFKAGAKIKSPSRVFMELGGHIVGGLNRGLDRGSGGAVDRISRLTRDMAAAAAMPVFAASAMLLPNAAAAGAFAARGTGIEVATGGGTSQQASRSGAGVTAGGQAMPAGAVTINIYGAVGQSPQDIAQAVRAEWDNIQREQRASDRSGFADCQDWT